MNPERKLKVLLEWHESADSGGPKVQELRFVFPPTNTQYYRLPVEKYWSTFPPSPRFDPRKLLGLLNRTVDLLMPGFSALITTGLGAFARADGFGLVHASDTCLHRFSVPTIYERSMTAQYLLRNWLGQSGKRTTTATRFEEMVLRSASCARIVAWTEWARSELLSAYDLDKDKVVVVPPPVEAPALEKTRDRSQLTVLFLGNDFHRKGGDIALKIFKKLGSEYPNLKMIMKSNVPVRFKQRLSRIRNLDVISGFVPLGPMYAQADVFFLPTRADSYGMSILEAMSRGIPVVTTDLPPLREIVTGGILCPNNQPEEYYEALCKLLTDNALRSGMGEQARDSVVSRFNPLNIAGRLGRLYEEATSPR